MSRLLTSLRTSLRTPAQSSKLSAPARRMNSTNSTEKAKETAQKAQEAAQDAAHKAQEKAQEAMVAAQKGLAKAVEAARNASGGIGEKAGSMLGSYREPVTYNFKVARELLKQVYVAERLAPPTSVQTVTNAYRSLWQNASSQAYWREVLRTGEYKRLGVYALEAYGIFKIGEILGRRHLVGYKLD